MSITAEELLRVSAFENTPFNSSPNAAPTIGAADKIPVPPLFFPDTFSLFALFLTL
jgi:hypothetical protein